MLQTLFAMPKESGEFLYLCVDPLLVADRWAFYDALGNCPAYALFSGTRLNAYYDKTPYLARVMPDSPLVTMFCDEKTGFTHSVVLMASALKLAPLAEHLQKFLFKKRYDGEQVLLRLYDPFVMQNFDVLFPEEQERQDFFSDINAVVYTASDRATCMRTSQGFVMNEIAHSREPEPA